MERGRRSRAGRALAVLRAVERRTPELPTSLRRHFLVRDRVVAAADAGPVTSHLAPHHLRGAWDHAAADVARIRARVAADLVSLAKFDLLRHVKMRAAYPERGLTVAAQPTASSGIRNAVWAHDVVSAHAPGLVPRLVSHGQLRRGLRYLVEEWVDGSPLTTSVRLTEAGPLILDGLSRVHQGHGVAEVDVRARWAQFESRWARLAEEGILPSTVQRQVADLIGSGRTVRQSLVHGDLVASNVLGAEGRVTLIDWEHASESPIMVDAAKLHLFSAEPEATLELVLDLMGRPGTAGRLGAVEELALAHAYMLSRVPERRAALEGHARAGVYDTQVRRQVDRLVQVLNRLR